MPKVYKVLIVEDERPMANALELKLNKSGFKAKAVFDGDSAVDILSKEKYDLVLLDLIMPKIDGFEVMKKMRDLKNDAKVIVLSNLSQEEDRTKAMAMGALDYFVKSDTPIAEIVKKVSDFFKANQ